MKDKGPLASLESERTLLGAVLLSNEVFFDGLADLTVSDFAYDSHQHIFSVMNEMLCGDGDRKVDLVTLGAELSRRKAIESVGGIAYLASLVEGLPRHLATENYVRIVKEKARKRRLVSIFTSANARARDESEPPDKIVEDIQSQLVSEAAQGDSSAVKIGEVTPRIEEDIEKHRHIGDERVAAELSWGVPKLDAFTKGAFLGELTVLAAESNGGKTAALTQMILTNAREGIPCAVFSIEMSKEKLGRRFYPQMGEVLKSFHIRDPRLMNEHTHVKEMHRLSSELRSLPIWIDDTSPISRNKLIARMRMMRRRFGIRLFAIDYLQLINGGEGKEVEEIRNTIYALRDFQKSEQGCHTLLLSQYSNEMKFIKKPKRSKRDLYGGSVIHHAAQNVVLVSIDNAEGKEPNELLEVEFWVAKQREGAVGKVQTYFDRDFLRYTDPQPILQGG